jgi:alpha-galactosidase
MTAEQVRTMREALAATGPGHWNDPDMLEVGNGMSSTEDQSEFSLWAEMAAPLISGTDIADASSTTLSILTNKNIIAIDQDPLGRQGVEVASAGGLDVLAKPLANGDVAVALFNETGSSATISTTAAAVGKSGASSYTLTDAWSGATSGTSGTISASVPAHGTVVYRVAGGSDTAVYPTGMINPVGAGKCLDVDDFSTTPGTQLWIWDCNGGSNQIWMQTPSGQLTVYSGSSQMCLDAAPSPASNQACASTSPEPPRTTARWRNSGPATAAATSSGRCESDRDSTDRASSRGTRGGKRPGRRVRRLMLMLGSGLGLGSGLAGCGVGGCGDEEGEQGQEAAEGEDEG